MSDPRPRILAIDDTPANLAVLAGALGGEFSFQLATSGPAGIAMAKTSPPDLILLDVMMPEVDGFETCRRLKADPQLRDIPIIFATALSDMGSEVEGLALGASDYVHKPLNLDIVAQRMRNLVERESLRRQVEAQRDHLEITVAERTRELAGTNVRLREALDAAEAASRTKCSFLANVSHEIRTPLNAIIGLTGPLLSRLADPALRTKVEKIRGAGWGLLHVFEQILQVADMDGNTRAAPARRFSVVGVVAAAHERHRGGAAAKALTLRTAIDPELPHQLCGDPIRLQQALENLLGNAVKFSDTGTITTRVTTVARSGNRLDVRFEVEDQGVGIAAEQQSQLFEPFVQGDNSDTRRFGGLGVGLAITRHLANLMAARIEVDSVPGRGSRFALVVPLSAVGDDDTAASLEAFDNVPAVAVSTFD